MPSIPPPGWNSDDPSRDPPSAAPEAVPADLSGFAGQFDTSAGPSPAQNLDEWVERLKINRAPDSSPSRWEVMGEKGAAGERRVAAALERALNDSETVRLYSQKVAKPVGDIDAVVVGPSGVTIVDSKHWGGEIVVDRDGILRQDGRIRHEKVDGMFRQRHAIRLALVHARPELRNVPVREVICLAQEESRGIEQLTGGVVLCGAIAAAELASAEGPLLASDIQEIRTVLLERLPKLRTDQLVGKPGVSPKRTTSVPRRRLRGTRGTNVRLSRPTATPRRQPSTGLRGTPRRRRRRSAGASVGSLLIAGLLLVIAVELLHFASRRDSPPSLVVTSQAGRSVVYVTAPDRDRVALRITAGRDTHLIHMLGIGTARRWVVPRAWSRTRWITVSACVVNSAGDCSSSSASSTNEFG